MGEGVRETLCSSCGHRDICAHKDNYLNMVKSLQEMFYKFPENEREFMYLRDPYCKFYSKILSTPKLPMQGIGDPKNMVMAMVGDGRKSCAEIFRRAMIKEMDGGMQI